VFSLGNIPLSGDSECSPEIYSFNFSEIQRSTRTYVMEENLSCIGQNLYYRRKSCEECHGDIEFPLNGHDERVAI
jgi:hypothetical protein